MPANIRGNCYAASEALYHIMGGRKSGWIPKRFKFSGPDKKVDTHWFLQHKETGVILDPSRKQFRNLNIPYEKGIGGGFLTKGPSRKARKLMEALTWQQI